MMRTLLTVFFLSIVLYSNAQYVFTGNGSWTDVNNWQGGNVPPNTIPSGATVTIQGSATTASTYPYDLSANNGTITIESGGSLAVNIGTQFMNQGIVTVNGTLTNNTTWEGYIGSSVTVNGTLDNKKTFGNQGLITVNSAGVINNTGSLDNTYINPGQIVLNCGTVNNTATGIFKPGTISLGSCGTINNSGTLAGNASITGSLANAATLSPCNSQSVSCNTPGTYTISGDYTAVATSVHNFKVAGTSSGSYDVLNVSGTVYLNGSLNVSLTNGFTPSTTHDLPIITGTIIGTFSTVNIPAGYTLVYTSNSVLLRHVEPPPVTDYTFTGHGSWNNPANWQGGLMPSNTIASGNNIYINGAAQTCSVYCNDLSVNNGTITIAAGDSLTLQADTIFVNNGAVIIDGTLINKSHWVSDKGSSITINGVFENVSSFVNAGAITINNGGLLKNTGLLDNTYTYTSTETPAGTIVVNSGGTLKNISPGIFKPGNFTNNGGTVQMQSVLSGNSTITGNLINAGTLAPGNSPGVYTVTGDYTATPGAIHNFEVAGVSSGNYDVLNVGGTVYLDGTLNVSLLNGFTPTTDHDLPIMTGTVSGTFATVNIPSSYQLVYNSNSVVLRHSSTLPVRFVTINIEKQGHGQQVSWKVQNEEDLLGYEVEKSLDGSHFTKIDFIKAAGVNNYSFMDVYPENKCYYRIRSVDQKGAYLYSSIGFYRSGSSSIKLMAFPSPANQKITVQHPTAGANCWIYVLTADGRLVEKLVPGIGTQETEIQTSSLKVGTYILKFHGKDGEEQSIKIQKL